MNFRHALPMLGTILSLAGTAVGQTEKVTLFADAAMTDCSITGNLASPGIVEVHMFHLGSGNRIAVEFLAPKPPCWSGAIWVGDVIAPPLLVIGNTQSVDISIAYTACLPLPVYLGRINYLVTNDSPPCCQYSVIPSTVVYPSLGPSVYAVVCPSNTLIAIGAGSAVVNEDPSCLCDPPLAVEETTWGRIKALYQ